jgi:ABC-2 type transport system ATP-binding protein
MPESPGLYPRLSVTENLDYCARLYGLPRRQERITEALAAVGLADRAHDLPGRLSKGLRQRTALAQVAAQRAGGHVPRRADLGA